MARRRLKNISVGRCTVTIHKDSEWGEFVVTTTAPVRRFRGTYYAADIKDARNTAAHQIRMMRRMGGCR